MKFLLVLAVLVIAYYIWRSNRRELPPSAPRRKSLAAPQEMVRCDYCGLFLPAADAVPASEGPRYCCTAHRDAAR